MVDFTCDFSYLPTRPFVLADKQAAFAGQRVYDSDPNGVFYSILPAGGMTEGPCIRMTYPAEATGAGHQQFQVQQQGRPGGQVNIEYYWMFEPGFDWQAGGDVAGKTAPRIVWGSLTSGTGLRVKWAAQNGTRWCFKPECVNLATSAQHGGNIYAQSIIPGWWYHIQMSALGGPAGFFKIWIDGLLELDVGPTPETILDDPVLMDFSSFFGGAGPTYAPTVTSYARLDNPRYWTGA